MFFLTAQQLVLRLVALVVPAMILGTACENALMEEEPEATPQAVFEDFWKQVDENYSFFALKNVNWQTVRDTFAPKLRPGMSDPELLNLLGDMLGTLRDGHNYIQNGFNRRAYANWYVDYPYNFDEEILERNYWFQGDAEPNYTGPLVHFIIDSVGYIYYGSFSGNISESNLNYVLGRFNAFGVKGIVFDVRNNGGGNPENGYKLVRRFIDQERPLYRYQLKDGPAHDDFTPLEAARLSPEGGERFTGPITVLTNRYCYSAANIFVCMMSELPNVTLLGDTTGGGGGVPAGKELPNGWVLSISSSRIFRASDDLNIELGIPPDTLVAQLPEDDLAGRDRLLEAAVLRMQ